MSDESPDDVTPIIFALQTEFDLPDNVATAATRLYEQYSDGTQEATRQRYLERTAGACLFLAGKVHGEAPLPGELAARVGEEKRLFLRTARNIAGDVGVDPDTITDPIQYIDLICEELEYDELVNRQAKLIVERAQEAEIVSGKGPRGIAAAAVYLGARIQRKKVTQHEIADVIDVSEVTIRNRYQEQAELEPPVYLADVEPSYFDAAAETTDADFLSVTWSGQDDPDSYVTPSAETFQAAVGTLEHDEETEITARAQTLYRLAQDAPQCDFASADQVDEWAVASVCVAAEQHDCDPPMADKETIADLVNMDAQGLEGRCYKLRRAWDSEVEMR